MTFSINTTWDGNPINHRPITLTLEPDRSRNLIISVEGHFFNDPKNPGGLPGQPFPGLWDYEGKAEILIFLPTFRNLFQLILDIQGKHIINLCKYSLKKNRPNFHLQKCHTIYINLSHFSC